MIRAFFIFWVVIEFLLWNGAFKDCHDESYYWAATRAFFAIRIYTINVKLNEKHLKEKEVK